MGKFIGRAYDKCAESIVIVAASAVFLHFFRGISMGKGFRRRFCGGGSRIAVFILNHHFYRKADYLFKGSSDQIQIPAYDLVPLKLGLYLQVNRGPFHFQRFDPFDPCRIGSGVHTFLELFKNKIQNFL